MKERVQTYGIIGPAIEIQRREVCYKGLAKLMKLAMQNMVTNGKAGARQGWSMFLVGTSWV